MRYLILIIFLLSPLYIYSQPELSIKLLDSSLNRLNKQLRVIQDSIKTLEMIINQEKLRQISINSFVCNSVTNSDASLRDKPAINGNVIFTIPKHKALNVLDYMGEGYWKVQYLNILGFMNESLLEMTPDMKLYKVDKNKSLEKIVLDKRLAQDNNLNQLPPKTSSSNAFTIKSKKDISIAWKSKMVYRIILNSNSLPSESEMKNIGNLLWKDGNTKWNDFTIFMYLPGMDITSPAYGIGNFNEKGLINFMVNKYSLYGTKWEKYAK